VADDLSAVLAEIKHHHRRHVSVNYPAPGICVSRCADKWPCQAYRAVAALGAALSFHQRVNLYGNAATGDEPGACPHDPDAACHFDGDGEWLCEGKPEGAVCSTCVDGQGGDRLEWPCPEYSAILAALTGESAAVVELEDGA
jgi:hypothetical protein